MEKEQLREKIYSKIDELPTIPAMLPKLLSLMEDEKSNALDVADAISHDPALTSKILKVANSAYYGFSQQISNLDQAVPLLGFKIVKSLALSIGVIKNLPSGGKAPLFSQEGLWVHSIAVATAMQELSKRFGKRNGNEHLFVIGLLHDIGKIVLDQFFHELFQQALEEARDSGLPGLYLAERNVIGLDHGEIGAMLLIRWKFPDGISSPIAVHHLKEIPEGTNVNDVAMLRVADALTKGLGLREEEDPILVENRAADLKILGIKEKGLEDVKIYLHSLENEIHAFFSAMV